MDDILIKNNQPGLLIIIEGIDGTGKSTQVTMLAEALEALGCQVVATREPTSGFYGQKIRQLYSDRSGVTKQQELELFLADRRQHVEELIGPALQRGEVVISDRYYLSTAAYQGASGLDAAEIVRCNEEFAPRPDLALLIEIPVSQSIHRIENLRQDNLNAFEQEDNLAKVASVFQAMDYDYIKRIDGGKSIEEVHSSIMMQVRPLLTSLD